MASFSSSVATCDLRQDDDGRSSRRNASFGTPNVHVLKLRRHARRFVRRENGFRFTIITHLNNILIALYVTALFKTKTIIPT